MLGGACMGAEAFAVLDSSTTAWQLSSNVIWDRTVICCGLLCSTGCWQQAERQFKLWQWA